MTIFKGNTNYKYISDKPYTKTVRVDRDTAIKLDDLLEFYITQTEETNTSLNQVIRGILTSFISNVETLETEDPSKASQLILETIRD